MASRKQRWPGAGQSIGREHPDPVLAQVHGGSGAHRVGYRGERRQLQVVEGAESGLEVNCQPRSEPPWPGSRQNRGFADPPSPLRGSGHGCHNSEPGIAGGPHVSQPGQPMARAVKFGREWRVGEAEGQKDRAPEWRSLMRLQTNRGPMRRSGRKVASVGKEEGVG